MFWLWLLKYSSHLVTGLVTLIGGFALHWYTARRSDLAIYRSHPQWVDPIVAQGQAPVPALCTFSLFLWNNGNAPARNVYISHINLPSHSVFPALPLEEMDTTGGGRAILFPIVPPKTLVTISYMFFAPTRPEDILSYVGHEDGTPKETSVQLQRVFSPWAVLLIQVLMLLGLWVGVNALFSLVEFLWVKFYLN